MKKIIRYILHSFSAILIVFFVAKYYSFSKHTESEAQTTGSKDFADTIFGNANEDTVQFVKKIYINLKNLDAIDSKDELSNLAFLLQLYLRIEQGDSEAIEEIADKISKLEELPKEEALSFRRKAFEVFERMEARETGVGPTGKILRYLEENDVAKLVDKVTNKKERLFLTDMSLPIMQDDQLRKYFAEALNYALKARKIESAFSTSISSISINKLTPSMPPATLVGQGLLYPGLILSLPLSSEEEFWLLNHRYTMIIYSMLENNNYTSFQDIMDSYIKVGLCEKQIVYAALAKNEKLSGNLLDDVLNYIMNLKGGFLKGHLLKTLAKFNQALTKDMYSKIEKEVGFGNFDLSNLLNNKVLSEGDKKYFLEKIINSPNINAMNLTILLIEVNSILKKDPSYKEIYKQALQRREQLPKTDRW